jgi:glyoxylase-like metal-dependent hydrolase (beta-lactamase superfamily II)
MAIASLLPATAQEATMRTFPAIAICALLAAGCDGIGEIETVEPAAVAEHPASWDEVFARPADIEVTAFVTGWVEAGPEILIDAGDPRVPDSLRRKIQVPSLAYLVENPAQGRVLLDAGLKSGDCAYGTRPVYWVPCRNAPGQDAVSQLARRGLVPTDLDAVVVSHFHGDHVSGLAALLRGGAPRVVTTAAELESVAGAFRLLSGYEASMLQERMKAFLVDPLMVEMPHVGFAADFFGDGSLWLIPVPGHTRGQLAALVNARSGPLLFTFDAAHLGAGFDLGVPPGATVDRMEAAASLENLRALAAAYPQVRVIYGHEPSQWTVDDEAVVLAAR